MRLTTLLSRTRCYGFTCASTLALLSSACDTSEFKAAADAGCEGRERCECFGNGTCNEGLTCLSNHCVRVADDGGVYESRADDGATESDGGVPGVNGTGSRPGSGAPSHPVGELGPADAATPSGSPDPVPTQPNESHPTPSQPAEPTNSSPSEPGPSAPEPSGSEPVEPGPVGSEPVGPEPIEPQPTPGPATPDGPEPSPTPDPGPSLPTPETPSDTTCPIELDAEHLCRASISGVPTSGTQFEYVWAVDVEGATPDSAARSLSYQDASEDGAVIVGSYREAGVTIDVGSAYVWRWGDAAIERLMETDGSMPTAINGDGSVVVGHDVSCSPDCEYTPTRWTFGASGNSPQTLPEGTTTPYAISDESAVVGFSRIGQDLQSFIWSSGEPELVDLVALDVIDGPGTHALGTNDSGQLLLKHDSELNAMPTGPDDFKPQIPTGLNRGGTLAIGQGWDGTYSSWFLWHIDDAKTDVILPLSDFDSAMPLDINSDGSVVVGVCQHTANLSEPISATLAFYWDLSHGMRSFEDELTRRGIQLPAETQLQRVSLSHDGHVALGAGYIGTTPILWRALLE